MRHADFVAEQMQDPEFRFWYRVYGPQFWLRGKLVALLFRVRDAAHSAALKVMGVSVVDVSLTESLGPTEASAAGPILTSGDGKG